jgi:hypothetical protein
MFSIDAILSRHFAFGLEVRKQRKMEVAVLPVGAMTPGAVYRNTKQFRVEPFGGSPWLPSAAT